MIGIDGSWSVYDAESARFEKDIEILGFPFYFTIQSLKQFQMIPSHSDRVIMYDIPSTNVRNPVGICFWSEKVTSFLFVCFSSNGWRNATQCFRSESVFSAHVH
jgi:hypothetical protein